MGRRLLSVALLLGALAALVGTVAMAATHRHGGAGARGGMMASATCRPPALAGSIVGVRQMGMDGGMMGGGMMGGGMMHLVADRSSVPAGTVSFVARNGGGVTHELVILPRRPGEAVGTRPVGADRRVSEAGALGEASRACGAGAGEGISAGAAGWVTIDLRPGRYELVCNLPGHYAGGMAAELDVE